MLELIWKVMDQIYDRLSERQQISVNIVGVIVSLELLLGSVVFLEETLKVNEIQLEGLEAWLAPLYLLLRGTQLKWPFFSLDTFLFRLLEYHFYLLILVGILIVFLIILLGSSMKYATERR